MECKYGLYTCAFRDDPGVCKFCEEGDSYEWDERLPLTVPEEEDEL